VVQVRRERCVVAAGASPTTANIVPAHGVQRRTASISTAAVEAARWCGRAGRFANLGFIAQPADGGVACAAESQTLMSLNDVVSAPAGADDCEAGGAGLVAEVEADAPFLPRAVRGEHPLEPGRPDRLQDPSAAPPQAAVHGLRVVPHLVVGHIELAGHEFAFGL